MNSLHTDMERYRECTRHVRNTYFAACGSFDAAWDTIDQWKEIDRLLFEHLVLRPHGVQPMPSGDPYQNLVVSLRGPEAPILINRDATKSHGYWDHPKKTVGPGELGMQFVSFFDFDEMSAVDLQYVMVRLVDALEKDLNGRAALVEWRYVELGSP